MKMKTCAVGELGAESMELGLNVIEKEVQYRG